MSFYGNERILFWILTHPQMRYTAAVTWRRKAFSTFNSLVNLNRNFRQRFSEDLDTHIYFWTVFPFTSDDFDLRTGQVSGADRAMLAIAARVTSHMISLVPNLSFPTRDINLVLDSYTETLMGRMFYWPNLRPGFFSAAAITRARFAVLRDRLDSRFLAAADIIKGTKPTRAMLGKRKRLLRAYCSDDIKKTVINWHVFLMRLAKKSSSFFINMALYEHAHLRAFEMKQLRRRIDTKLEQSHQKLLEFPVYVAEPAPPPPQ